MAFPRTPRFLVSYRTPIVTTLVLLVLWTAFQSWCWWGGESKLAGLDLPAQGKIDIAVEMPFQPEQFHLTRFQATGRYVGWRDDRAIILDAPVDDVRALARQYWVSGLERAKR